MGEYGWMGYVKMAAVKETRWQHSVDRRQPRGNTESHNLEERMGLVSQAPELQ